MDESACEVRLRSGDPVWIRPIRSTDAAELQRAFALMSEESQYRRFLTGTPRLTDSQATYFTAIDHVDHEAYVAHSPSDETWIIGVARFIRYPEAREDAELAITVADSWHGSAPPWSGCCASGRSRWGVNRFRAEMMGDNEAILRLLRGNGLTDETVDGDRVVGRIDLAGAHG